MTVTVSATFNLSGFEASRLKARVPAILRAYDKKLYPAFKTEISASQFSWPNVTKRRNGKVVRSPRDIVDTGAFRASQRRRTEGSRGTELVYSWGNSSVPYASIILKGYSTKNGTYPPRDWITPALAKNPLEKFFREEWARLAARGL